MRLESTDSRPRAAIAAVFGIALAAAVVRMLAAPGDLYFDEIFSLGLARSYLTPWNILTGIHVDNNHYLTTMWMSLLRDNGSAILFRLPAFLCGIASVPLGAVVAWRRGAADAVFTALLLGSSFLLIEYSTEARGYTPALAMVFLCWLVARKCLRDKSVGWVPLFWLAAVVGLLSQLVFLQFYLGLLAWTAGHLIGLRAGWSAVLRRGLLLHSVPLVVIALVYYYDVRHMQVGGGQQYDALQLVVRVFSFTLGGPAAGPLAVVFATAGVMSLVMGIILIARRKDSEWILYVVAILVAPLVAVMLGRSSYLYARYFLVGITLLLCLTGHVLAELWRRGNFSRMLAAALAGTVVVANAWHTQPLLVYGRGGYGAALQMMARETDAETIVAGTDHDFRHGLVMGFHSRKLPDHKQLVLICGLADDSVSQLESLLPRDRRAVFASRNQTLPEWFVMHRIEAEPALMPHILLNGNRYELVRRFPRGSLSGWEVFVYRREDAVIHP